MLYQRVLVPVSGKHKGDRARKVLDHALRVVEGELILLHAYAELPHLVGGEARQELVREREADALNTVAPIRAMVEQAGARYRVLVEEGPPAEVISRVATEEKCDLIVMFTDGENELVDLLLGSISERVLRMTHTPLLVIRR